MQIWYISIDWVPETTAILNLLKAFVKMSLEAQAQACDSNTWKDEVSGTSWVQGQLG